MAEAVNLILRKVPFEDVKEFSEERYDQLLTLTPYLQSFNIFILSKNLGITFRPEDLTLDQLFVFTEIQETMMKYFKDKK